MAGNLTVQQCGNVFKTNAASAHYGVNGNNIGCYVDESNTAWHCGNWGYNLRSIGIELAND
ncbi:MAG: N-acetylmuramoyl-L-alanine amidase [Mogibacterium sp.]|nr:N-acetylmuramoyl-L-alanine amidase [Mogibacterium sp.]